jgi:hypothetical protein
MIGSVRPDTADLDLTLPRVEERQVLGASDVAAQAHGPVMLVQ